MEIIALLAIPLSLAVIALFLRDSRRMGIVNAVGNCAAALIALRIAYLLAMTAAPLSVGKTFYVDSLSAFFIFTIAVLNIASSLYSIGYIAEDAASGAMPPRKVSAYYALFNIFSFSMFFVTVLNNLGLVWVAIEMTTLASAFLVGFHKNKPSVEAAWKYIMICSVGIALALFGTILFYYAASSRGGIASINWTDLMVIASRLDPKVVKIAFLFILVGYGTKAGLVPMHTWLPDAHSQALSPVSALLSGVLLKTALYAIVRFAIVLNVCVGAGFSSHLFLFFGLLSLGVSAGFVLVQKDLKRLLAYSSIEHVGIICIGLGIGGPLGIYGALLHVFNHGVTKSAMFFGAGNIVKKYGTHTMSAIHGVMRSMPFTGTVLIIATFALVGMPPFSIFVSEFMILIAAFGRGAYAVSGLFLFFIAVVFGGMVFHLGKIIFGKPPAGMPIRRELLSGKAAFAILLAFVCFMGFRIPWLINTLIVLAVDIIRGVS